MLRTEDSISIKMSSIIAKVALVSLTVCGGVSAGFSQAENQLETARLTQAAQRDEFGVEGPESAFKFSFSDPVCFFPSYYSKLLSKLMQTRLVI